MSILLSPWNLICNILGVFKSAMKKETGMFFDDRLSEKIDKYGFGMTAQQGRYHFMACIDESHGVRRLCMARPCNDRVTHSDSIQWFDTESSAVRAFRKNKNACHKCLRVIETIELDLEKNKAMS